MSGGVGPTCNDISLPKEQETEHKQASDPTSLNKIHTKSPKSAFLSFPQLNALAIIIIFSATGMVSPEDLSFVFFSFLYFYFLSEFAFPPLHSANEPNSTPVFVFSPQNKILRLYVTVGAIIGLLLPILYIFEGVFEGDKQGIKAAAPHVFLLGSQVFMEGISFADARFSLPVRVFVPVFYNSRRVLTLVDWVKNEFSKIEDGEGYGYGGSATARRVYVGRVLAVANLGFWCFNLFGFLLPVYLPKAFKKYYSLSKV